MSLGEVDTLNLLTDKLQALFDESQGYYETFLDTNKLYKDGKISDKEFDDYVKENKIDLLIVDYPKLSIEEITLFDDIINIIHHKSHCHLLTTKS